MSSTGPLRGERGSGSLWVLITASLLACCGLLVVLALALVVARARTATAADLAALAAVSAREATSPCALAGEVAAAHGSHLHRCLVRSTPLGMVADVEVTSGWSSRMPGVLTVRSRAGPAAALGAVG